MSDVETRADLDAILCGKHQISRLQELCQQWKFPLPVFKEAMGTYNQFANEVTVTVEGTTVTFLAMARTKKLAKTKAAEEALLFISSSKPHLLQPPSSPEVDQDLFQEIRAKAQANKQRAETTNMQALARETEELSHTRVNLDLSRLIQQSRTKLGLSQKEFATRINEKPIVVTDYESGRAIPNDQILVKMERTLGVYLKGERAGQPKVLGRGAKKRIAQ